jgi:hypothetical protein
MGYAVPSGDDAKDAGKTGGVNGAALALGEAAGRAVIGRGPGTAIGGLAAAASETGTHRDTMSIIAIERAVNEMTGGSGA